MTRRRPERPSLAAQRESIVPTAAPAIEPESAPEVPTSTLSLRVPTAVYEQVQREIRRLHFETGRPKGEIAAALLSEALSRIDQVQSRLS